MSIRKIIYAAVLVFVSFSATAQIRIIPKERLDSIANPPLAAESAYMMFEELNIKAQPMLETDAPKTFEYRFENTGTQPVTISRLVSTCSCASASYNKKTVPPGHKGTIYLRYNPEGHPGRFVRRVFVYTGENKQPSAVLRLSVVVNENIKDN